MEKMATDDNDSQTAPLVNQTEEEDDDDGSKKNTKRISKLKQNWKIIVEVVLLVLLLFLLWVVYAAVPTVFYVLRPALQVTRSMLIECTMRYPYVNIIASTAYS